MDDLCKSPGSQTFVALLLVPPSLPNTLLECPYSFHGGDENWGEECANENSSDGYDDYY